MKTQVFKYFLLFCLVISSTLIYAQKEGMPRIDSLFNMLRNSKDDTNKVNILVDISTTYRKINPDSGLKFGQQALEIARHENWDKGEADAFNAIGANYYNKSEYIRAMDNHMKSLKIYENLHYTRGMASALNNIGNIYSDQQDYSKALEYYQKALKIYEDLTYLPRIPAVLNNIGLIYLHKTDYSNALKYFSRADKMDEEAGKKGGSALMNMGVVYEDMGDYKMALQTFNKSLGIETENGNKSNIGINLRHIGNVYFKMAMDSSTQSLREFFSGNKRMALKKAKNYQDSAIAVFKSIGDLFELRDAYLTASEAAADLGDSAEALDEYKNYCMVKDSVFSIDKNKHIAQLSVLDDFNKKAALDEAEVKKQKIIKFIVLIGLLLCALLALSRFISLRQSWRKTNIIQQERKRADELLLNILPSEVAQELKQNGSAKARRFDRTTVMFADFCGFAVIDGQLPADKLVDEINYCFTEYDNIIKKYGVEKIKTIGDSYMAACGLPLPDEENAEKILNACLDILTFMNQYKSGRIKENRPYFEVRIGVNSGPVVAGIVGVKKFAYDIWGDTVNTAARMEQHSEAGKINISGSTFELVKDKFKCGYRGKIHAKNKGEIDMYFVEQ